MNRELLFTRRMVGYKVYIIDQNPHSSFYGTTLAKIVGTDTICPQKPEYDSSNDAEFVCWLLISATTADNDAPLSDWSNIDQIYTTPYTVNSTYNNKVQVFGQTKYPLTYTYEDTTKVYTIGFIASYVADYGVKWTFALPQVKEAYLEAQETQQNVRKKIDAELQLIEQRVNKAGANYDEYNQPTISLVNGKPTFTESLYPASTSYFDISPSSLIDLNKIVRTENSVDLTNSFYPRHYTNWQYSTPLDYCPMMFKTQKLVDTASDEGYAQIYNCTDSAAITLTDTPQILVSSDYKTFDVFNDVKLVVKLDINIEYNGTRPRSSTLTTTGLKINNKLINFDHQTEILLYTNYNSGINQVPTYIVVIPSYDAENLADIRLEANTNFGLPYDPI